MSLAGRNVLITGSNRGVGAALVTAALDRSAATVYAGARTPASIEKAHPKAGARIVPIPLDVTDTEQVDAAATRCQDVDLLVLNAGVTCIMPAIAAPDEMAFRQTMEVNFFGPLHLLRAFAPALKVRHSGVLIILSVAGVTLSRSAPLYSASKAAALMLGLGVREELRDDGVTVTLSLPGFIKTDMSQAMSYPKASPEQVAERSLDGWISGVHTVWPDRFSELVSERIGSQMREVLDHPRDVMNAVIQAYVTDAQAGN